MKNIRENRKIWIMSGGYLLAVLLAAFFLAKPLLSEIAKKADAIQEKIIGDELNSRKIGEIAAMKKERLEFQEKEEKLKIVLEESEEIGFVKEVESLGESSGNKISFKIEEKKPDSREKNVSNQKPETAKDIPSELSHQKYFIMQISLEGNYSGLLNFLKKLENMKNYVNVVALSSEKTDEPEEIGSSNAGVFGLPAVSPAVPQKGKERIKSLITAAVYLKER